MARVSLLTHAAVALFFIISLGTSSAVYGDQLLFADDFSDGSATEWQVQVGEWYVGGGAYCVSDCGG